MIARERVYRAAMTAYPRSFREHHGECMLGTLLDGAGQRGVSAEARELAALALGGLRARGDHARRAERGAWRHGVAGLLAPLAAVNLGVMVAGFAFVLREGPGGRLQGISAWWVLATIAAAGLLLGVGARRRGLAIGSAVAGLVPLGFDEWLQATGRGDRDHFSVAAQQGFDGPLMSPFWLFLAAAIVVASLAWRPEPAHAGPRRRLAALVVASLAIAALLPLSLHVLLALALVGMAVSVPLGTLDRRVHGAGIALWLISLPYVTWWWTQEPVANQTWLGVYITVLPVMALTAVIARRRRRHLVT